MDYQEIGQRIKRYRKARNLSQEQLAERVGISPTHMSHIETGSTKLSLPVLVDIARELRVQADALLSDPQSAPGAELAAIIESCTDRQLTVVTEVVRALKATLDGYGRGAPAVR